MSDDQPRCLACREPMTHRVPVICLACAWEIRKDNASPWPRSPDYPSLASVPRPEPLPSVTLPGETVAKIRDALVRAEWQLADDGYFRLTETVRRALALLPE